MASRRRKNDNFHHNQSITQQRNADVISELNRQLLLSESILARKLDRHVDIVNNRRQYMPSSDQRRLFHARAITIPTSRDPRKIQSKTTFRATQEPVFDIKRQMVCTARKKRRESLFRQGSAGKGKRVSRFRRYTEDSRIHCRR